MVALTDPVSDMLTRIQNAQAVNKETVSIPFSKLKYSLAQILERRGLIRKIEIKGRRVHKVLILGLKYQDGESKISRVKKVSKPGPRSLPPCLSPGLPLVV